MILKKFTEKFPEFENEKIITNIGNMPTGEYIIYEYYCTDNDCDCRKVRLIIEWPDWKSCTFEYWWETKEFYMKLLWDEKMAEELDWLSIDAHTKQPEYVNELFKYINEMINEDIYYVALFVLNYAKMNWIDKNEEQALKEAKRYLLFKKSKNELISEIMTLQNKRKVLENKKKTLEKKKLKIKQKKKLAKKQRKVNKKK